MNQLTVFLLLVALTLSLDAVWIKLVMEPRYTEMIRGIQNTSMMVRFIPVLITYALIIGSIYLLAYPHVRATNLVGDSLYYGGLLGLAVYGIFSFTNYSLIRDWTLPVAILDTAWGFILYSISVGALVYISGGEQVKS